MNIYKANVQSLLKNKVGTAARQPLSDQYLFKTLKQGMDKLAKKKKNQHLFLCMCFFDRCDLWVGRNVFEWVAVFHSRMCNPTDRDL